MAGVDICHSPCSVYMGSGAKVKAAELLSSTHEDNDEHGEVKTNTSSQKSPKFKIETYRIVVGVLVLLSAVAFTLITNSSLRKAEDDTYRAQYKAIAGELQQGISAAVNKLHVASTSMALSAALAYPNSSSWPNASIPGYSQLNDNIHGLSNSRITLSPIVLPEEVHSFEVYAREAFIRDPTVPEDTAGYNDFGFGVFSIGINGERYHDTTGATNFSNYNFLTPILMSAFPARSTAFLFNTHSEIVRGSAMDAVYNCVQQISPGSESRCFSMTDVVQHISDNKFEGTTLLYAPIFSFADGVLVGFSTLGFSWDGLLIGLLSHVVDSVECVISTSTVSFTIELKNGVPSVKGIGDLHNKRFDSTRVEQTIALDTMVNSSSVYTVAVFSTRELYSSFHTNLPLIATLSCLCIILLNMVAMLFYDRLISDDRTTKDIILKHKRDFVRFVSHEVRTPLNSVSLGLRYLEEELQDKVHIVMGSTSVNSVTYQNLLHNECDSVRSTAVTNESIKSRGGLLSTLDLHNYLNLLREIQVSTGVAVSVLNDFLQYDKIEAGKMQLESKPVSFHNIVLDNLKLFRVQAAELHINIVLRFNDDVDQPPNTDSHLNIPTSIPSTQRNLVVMGDSARLGQVVRNLVSNAIKFSNQDSTIIVKLEWKMSGLPDKQELAIGSVDLQPAGSLVLTVIDRGPGLTPIDLGNLFKEGVQFNPNELQGGQGSGLGLWISKGIVNMHHGRVWAESAGLEKGCSFFAELPALQTSNTPQDLDAGSKQQEVGIKRSLSRDLALQGLNVLVVDDASSNRKCVVRLLQRRKCVCITAEDGIQAVDVMKSDLGSTIDCILMDNEMPKVSTDTIHVYLYSTNDI